MPNLLTHYIYSHEAIKAAANADIAKTVTANENVFNLGAQGPDIFFYYKALNFLGAKNIRKIGSRMHKELTGDYFYAILKYIKETNSVQREMLSAYLYGILCHYAIDLTTHPYIYYKTGFVRTSEVSSYKYSCYHRDFETSIDVILSHEKLSMHPYDIKPYKLISLGLNKRLIIAGMLSQVLNSIYSASITSKHVNDSITSMYKVFYILNDRTGIKRHLFDMTEKLLHQPAVISSAVYPIKINKDIDFMNKNHSIWYLPWDNNSIHSESFYELLNKAITEAKALCEAAYAYLDNNMSLSDIVKRIGCRSYASGLDCNINVEFKYYDVSGARNFR